MNDREEEHHLPLRDHYNQELDAETMLETRIAHVLQEQAALVQFTPAQRERVMRRIATRPKQTLFSAPFFIVAAALVVVLSFGAYLLQSLSSSRSGQPIATVHYSANTLLDTPRELADGGQPVSLDPTGQHLAYRSASEPGVIYTANLSNPTESNFLAMRYARDVVWSPDGSAVVTTIAPPGVAEPLLALVHTGHYMDTLGHAALAASWSPTSNQEIVYITEENGVAKLWSTAPIKDSTPQLLTTFPLLSLVQRLVWSEDGHTLALVTTDKYITPTQALTASSDTIVLVDMQTWNVHTLPLPANAALGKVLWSPNGHYLTYEQLGTQGPTALHTIDVATQKESFTVTLKQKLLGWSWSPQSDALVYSDGGVLAAHVLHGAPLAFPKANAGYPLWLADGRLLVMKMTDGTGTLEILLRQTQR